MSTHDLKAAPPIEPIPFGPTDDARSNVLPLGLFNSPRGHKPPISLTLISRVHAQEIQVPARAASSGPEMLGVGEDCGYGSTHLRICSSIGKPVCIYLVTELD